MVTVDKSVQYFEGVAYTNSTYYGLSTDEKPEAAANGAAFIEMDSGKVYFFDASEGGSGWIEWGA